MRTLTSIAATVGGSPSAYPIPAHPLTVILSASFIAGDDPCDNLDEPHLALNQWRRTLTGLPSGTVTFLFTDIEGSTALWERDQAAMQTAVDRHLDLNHNAAMFPRGIVD